MKKLNNSSSKILSGVKNSNQKDKIQLMPKISLNMQMKVYKILKNYQLMSFIGQ